MCEFLCSSDPYKTVLETLVLQSFMGIDIMESGLSYFDRLEKTIEENLPQVVFTFAYHEWRVGEQKKLEIRFFDRNNNKFLAKGILEIKNPTGDSMFLYLEMSFRRK
jgi:hypothetical protein